MFKKIARACITHCRTQKELLKFKLRNRGKASFICPVCNYNGPFRDIEPETGIRKHALCPKCGSLERHRLQYLVLTELAKEYDFAKMSMLHFAPEPFFRNYFKKMFNKYISADLFLDDVSVKVDLTNLAFGDEKYDFVFASHVIEHIKKDFKAIAEIKRVLKPRGVAVLPVPIVADKTVEYLAPSPAESGHVRAPGFDYYDRYRECFSVVKEYQSNDFPSIYQTFIYEDRANWPTEDMPFRSRMDGEKHRDVVPVCFV